MKRGRYALIFFLIMLIIMVPLVFAGLFDWFKEITGQATDAPLDMNISVGTGSAPTIIEVWNITDYQTNNLGPANSNITFNFTASDADGYGNLNDNSVKINITNSGTGRANTTDCARVEESGNLANYSCNVTMWWWDSDGAWTINVSISDNNYNNITNDTTIFIVNTLTGFVSGPGNISFDTMQPNTYNNTPTNWITLNNTGNQDVSSGNVQVNATDLKGETTSTQALWAANFSIGTTTSADKPECDLGENTATNMTDGSSGDVFKSISGSLIAAGNYTVNNNVTGQETLYMCLQYAGIGLSQQQYSTVEEGTWTMKIV